VDGKKHGQWWFRRDPDGTGGYYLTYRNGNIIN